jgi:hypothetical protein
MAKTKKQNSVKISAGGYTLSPTYSTAYSGSNYSNITITGGTGSAGITYTTAATTNPTWVVDSYYTKRPKVEITESDLVIDGLSLKETMLAVKDELMIPTRINRNLELEKEFAELKTAADRYYKLEQKFLEQKKMWETLKKTDQ